MSELLREIEGTWEEVAALGAQFAGQRVRLTLLDETGGAEDVLVPPRPQPTPEQAALGIVPPAFGKGTYEDVMQSVRSASRFSEPEFREFEQALADNRASRRQAAQEQA